MKRVFLVLGTVVVIVPWISGARARADLIQWSASESVDGIKYGVGGTSINSRNYGSNASIGLGQGTPTSGTNSGSVVLAYLSAFYYVPSSFAPAIFGGSSGNYSLGLTLLDDASGTSGSLTFYGNLSGLIYPSAGYGAADITNTFLGSTTQTLQLGQDLYTVTIGSFVPPGDPTQPYGGGGPEGSISATISVQPLTSSTPEPSSLLLACLGLPSLGLAVWRRRQRIHTGAG